MKPSSYVAPLTRILIGLLLATTVASPVRADYIGVTFSPGDVYRFDESGGATLVGPSGFRSLNSLAKDSSGNLYVQGFSDVLQQSGFVRIDPSTGIGTLVAPNANSLDVRGLAFGASDTLFAIVDGGFGQIDKLYTINLSTGVGQLIGSTGFKRIQSLQYDASTDTLFAWDSITTAGLIKINPATGAGTDVSAVGAPIADDIQALAISADGTLFGAGTNLYSIDATTGALTFVSNIGQEVRGLAFIVDGPVGLTGDYNDDGTVDAADYVAWRKGIGVATTEENYDLWRTNFGQTSGGSAVNLPASRPAPEPNGRFLIIMGIVSISGRRRN